MFTQDKSGYFSNSILKKWDRGKVFTINGCSLIKGVHFERFHCTTFGVAKLKIACIGHSAPRERY